MSDSPDPSGPAMRIGVAAEADPETRVAMSPETVAKVVGLGYAVTVESGAGARAGFTDEAYTEAGADVVDGPVWDTDIVVRINAPEPDEIGKLREGAVLIAMLAPRFEAERTEALTAQGVTALSMDAVPRISRAQSMDVLSSMANIAGYRAVIEAAHVFGRFFTGQVTAAGKVPPAKVLVAGAGVAGLAAIAAANSLGAVVRATDPRSEVADQVRSLGGEYLAVEVEQEASTDGYAKATSADYDKRAAEIYSEQAADCDIIITTALIPGRPAPKLITAADVASMRPGSVVVDMAASQGGNVEGSVAGEVVVTDHGVTVVGYTDLAARLPAQASQLYGTNVLNLLKLMTPEKDGRLALDLDDTVVRGITTAHAGETLWPPPEVTVSAAPAAQPAEEPKEKEPEKPRSPYAGLAAGIVGALALFAVTALAPAELAGHLTVFVLAIVIGFYVIGNVHHALHTPLMSVTNAISGIIVVGAILQIGTGGDALVIGLAAVAVLLAAINIVGGFAVTRRMLQMFTRS
ncbi:NAD(P) transhydrogenase subunit alpha [Pseudonocardia antarctica]|jgi:NAD(P) transhydrogenase subunit alpha|uniref:NAD(P) transhydrogenase subunit alpha n=2 Tax=Pseudonocardiaceae TaxID=2070 RepID=A0A852VXU1_PSEA5|nr:MULTISPECIES: Re/Si-specific NAD(P)(+) transhydrogenase subunit alpha [Pseudonocardia]MCO7191962.1 Re/Si-specific NAD(P)(+) transhydrogenase subunit alpha [Pseudonocardia sp. McavD-2-B]NYG01748.1 NAD(P) transhydrogenase subunit alpha [Pseudonocardia antarctica]